jgi:hypothetical protein
LRVTAWLNGIGVENSFTRWTSDLLLLDPLGFFLCQQVNSRLSFLATDSNKLFWVTQVEANKSTIEKTRITLQFLIGNRRLPILLSFMIKLLASKKPDCGLLFLVTNRK